MNSPGAASCRNEVTYFSAILGCIYSVWVIFAHFSDVHNDINIPSYQNDDRIWTLSWNRANFEGDHCLYASRDNALCSSWAAKVQPVNVSHDQWMLRLRTESKALYVALQSSQ